MSRIYEALQKAESERGLDRGDQRESVEEQPIKELPFTGLHTTAPPPALIDPLIDPEIGPIANPIVEPIVEPIAEQLTEQVARPSESAARSVPGGLDLQQVAVRPWALKLNQLPALEERGKSVEQFRSLRSRLFELRDIKPLKSLLISSGLPQEGKSFVSTNLALSLARHKNSKVLLIDGDMRRYTLHQILGCESHPGLADYLAGKANPAEVMQRPEVIEGASSAVRAVLSNLTFIAGGNGGDKAADLSGSPRFGELLRLAAPYFDWIIVDSSPVLPVSDSVNLARSCDGVLLVARGGVTKFQTAQRAHSEFKAANVLGFVLNAVENTAQVGGYYSYDAANR